VDVIEGFEPKKSAPAPRSARKPGGWKPGDGRGGKPGQRSFSKPGAPRKEGGGFGGKSSRFAGDGNRRSFGDR
jgi:hypothetical protein